MKLIIFSLITLFSFQSFAVELSKVFPLTCALYYDGDTEHPDLVQTFHDLDEVDTLGGAPFWWRVSDDENDDAKYVFGMINGQFRAQYRRSENEQEKISHFYDLSVKYGKSQSAKDLAALNAYSETIIIKEYDTKYADLENLVAGQAFTFSSKETPDVVLKCQKEGTK